MGQYVTKFSVGKVQRHFMSQLAGEQMNNVDNEDVAANVWGVAGMGGEAELLRGMC